MNEYSFLNNKILRLMSRIFIGLINKVINKINYQFQKLIFPKIYSFILFLFFFIYSWKNLIA